MSVHRRAALPAAASLAAAWLFAMPVAAQTIAEDEARIEELVRRELALRGKLPADSGPAEDRASNSALAAEASAPAEPGPVVAASAPTDAPAGAETPPTGQLERVPDNEPPAEPTIFANATLPKDPAGIALADLAAHTGQVVRVRSIGGRTHVGRIESVGNETLTLRVRMGGGHATFDLGFAQIEKVTRP